MTVRALFVPRTASPNRKAFNEEARQAEAVSIRETSTMGNPPPSGATTKMPLSGGTTKMPLSGAMRSEAIARLRTEIARIEAASSTGPEGTGAPAPGPVPFGIAAIDGHLPGGGLATGAVHEIIAGDDGMAATGFALAFAARLFDQSRRHAWLWCGQGSPLYAPGLAAFGLTPEAGLVARAASDREVLWAMEEGLACRALAIVFGEVENLDDRAGRRLALAARESGTTAVLLRRRGAEGTPSVAATRWRVRSVPLISESSSISADTPTSANTPTSTPTATVGIGNIGGSIGRDGYAWRLDFLRGHGAMPRSWQVLWRPGAVPSFSRPTQPRDRARDRNRGEDENREACPAAGALSLAPPLPGGTDSQGEATPWRARKP